MRPNHHTLDRNQVHRFAAQHLQAHLQFRDYKRKTTANVLWSLLLAAAARITSLSDACQRLKDAPCDETARQALLATLPQGFREWLCRNCFPQHEVRFSSQRVVLVEDQVDLTLAPLLDHHRMLQEVPPHGGETQRPIAPR